MKPGPTAKSRRVRVQPERQIADVDTPPSTNSITLPAFRRVIQARYAPSLRWLISVILLGGLLAIISLLTISFQRTVWQEPDYPYRIRLDIPSNSSRPALTSTNSFVLPIAFLPPSLVGTDVEATARSDDGSLIPLQLAPQDTHRPLIGWLSLSPTTTVSYIYLRKADPLPTSTANPDLSANFLLFDPFNDWWLPGWMTMNASNGDLPPRLGVSDPAGIARQLPAASDGYTVEAAVSEDTNSPGGPSVAIASSDTTIELVMLNHSQWRAQILGQDQSFSQLITWPTQPKQPVVIRLDVPAHSGADVRFFLNGSEVAKSPLESDLAGRTNIYLFRPDHLGYASFNFIAVRPYDPNTPALPIAPIEADVTNTNLLNRLLAVSPSYVLQSIWDTAANRTNP